MAGCLGEPSSSTAMSSGPGRPIRQPSARATASSHMFPPPSFSPAGVQGDLGCGQGHSQQVALRHCVLQGAPAQVTRSAEQAHRSGLDPHLQHSSHSALGWARLAATAQHNTAQHSTAATARSCTARQPQHGSAQHGSAGHSVHCLPPHHCNSTKLGPLLAPPPPLTAPGEGLW